MANWETISIENWKHKRKGQPGEQEGDVNWKVEKEGLLKGDATRPMLTIKQARDNYMAGALQVLWHLRF